MKRIWHLARLWALLEKANLRSQLAYPFNFFIGLVSIAILGVSSMLLTWVVTRKVPDIGGWNFYEMIFMYAMWRTCHALFNIFGNQLIHIDYFVRQGFFDRYLVRPVHPLFSYMTMRIDVGGFGDLTAGLLGMAYALYHYGEWSAVDWLLLPVLIGSGAAIQWSLFVIIGSCSFWTMQSGGLRSIMESFLYTFTRFPQNIYSMFVQVVMTFLLPIGFISFYPAHALFGHEQQSPFSPLLAFLTPAVACVMVLIALRVWSRGLNAYKGAGS